MRTRFLDKPGCIRLANAVLARSVGRLRMLADAWLPASCALCSLPPSIKMRFEAGICDSCVERLAGAAAQRCPVCAIRLPAGLATGTPCARCDRSPPAFEHTVVLADYAPPLDRLIHAMKFGSDLAAARALGKLLAIRVHANADAKPQLLVAVPLAPARLATRGYNQSEAIARALARSLGIPLVRNGLLRIRETAAQSSLALAGRSANLHDAFSAATRFDDRVVGLVDDVMTSGATLQAIACILKQAGARRVVNLVAARTP